MADDAGILRAAEADRDHAERLYAEHRRDCRDPVCLDAPGREDEGSTAGTTGGGDLHYPGPGKRWLLHCYGCLETWYDDDECLCQCVDGDPLYEDWEASLVNTEG